MNAVYRVACHLVDALYYRAVWRLLTRFGLVTGPYVKARKSKG